LNLARNPQIQEDNCIFIYSVLLMTTVKASNFGPHGNFGPLFSEGLAMIEMRPTEKRRE
jgi:hypothetical protein